MTFATIAGWSDDHAHPPQQRQMKRLGEAADRVTQVDRRYFERFPQRRHRVRVASAGEAAQYTIARGQAINWPPNTRLYVAIRNVRPGMRIRVFLLGHLSNDAEFDELAASQIYEWSAGSTALELERLMPAANVGGAA